MTSEFPEEYSVSIQNEKSECKVFSEGVHRHYIGNSNFIQNH